MVNQSIEETRRKLQPSSSSSSKTSIDNNNNNNDGNNKISALLLVLVVRLQSLAKNISPSESCFMAALCVCGSQCWAMLRHHHSVCVMGLHFYCGKLAYQQASGAFFRLARLPSMVSVKSSSTSIRSSSGSSGTSTTRRLVSLANATTTLCCV